MTYPDMCKYRRVRRFTISPKILSYHCRNSHCNTNKTVLVNPSPNNIEPSQTTSRRSPRTPLSTTTFSPPIHRQDPFLRSYASEIHFLFVEIGRDVMAEKRKEGCYGECFVAIGYDLEIYCVPVIPEGEECCCGIDWYHEQDSNDAGRDLLA